MSNTSTVSTLAERVKAKLVKLNPPIKSAAQIKRERRALMYELISYRRQAIFYNKPDAGQCMVIGCYQRGWYKPTSCSRDDRGYCEKHKHLACTKSRKHNGEKSAQYLADRADRIGWRDNYDLQWEYGLRMAPIQSRYFSTAHYPVSGFWGG